MKKYTLVLIALAIVACGEKKQAPANQPPAAAAAPAATPQTEYVKEEGYFETISSLKLRKSPSVTAPLATCGVVTVGACQSSGCGGEISVLNKGDTVRTRRRTAAKEKQSGAEGYWYQVGYPDADDDKCGAWVFGGFLKSKT